MIRSHILSRRYAYTEFIFIIGGEYMNLHRPVGGYLIVFEGVSRQHL